MNMQAKSTKQVAAFLFSTLLGVLPMPLLAASLPFSKAPTSPDRSAAKPIVRHQLPGVVGVLTEGQLRNIHHANAERMDKQTRDLRKLEERRRSPLDRAQALARTNCNHIADARLRELCVGQENPQLSADSGNLKPTAGQSSLSSESLRQFPRPGESFGAPAERRPRGSLLPGAGESRGYGGFAARDRALDKSPARADPLQTRVRGRISDDPESYAGRAAGAVVEVIQSGYDGKQDHAVIQTGRTLALWPAVGLAAIGGNALDTIREPLPGLRFWSPKPDELDDPRDDPQADIRRRDRVRMVLNREATGNPDGRRVRGGWSPFQTPETNRDFRQMVSQPVRGDYASGFGYRTVGAPIDAATDPPEHE